MSAPTILEGALLAQAAGFAVHYQRGKRAFEPCWSSSPPKIAEELRQDYRDGYNIGFRTGDWSKLDGWPVVGWMPTFVAMIRRTVRQRAVPGASWLAT